mgnify:CR=1 FL=1
MQILLSPAKDMTDSPSVSLPSLTTPLFLAEAEHNAAQMSELTTEELSQLLKINPQLAALNKQRYTDFPALTPQAAGMAYRYLRAAEFSSEDLAYAQQHLWMTSFLYGLTRPLDGIKNYRLEGNVVLPEHDGQTMFQFWRTRLTDVLIDAVKADDGVLFFLASGEMKQLFDWKRVTKEVKVIMPTFQVMTNGKLKTIVVYTKMMRHLITNRVTATEDWLSFEYEGFSLLPDSTELRPAWAIL